MRTLSAETLPPGMNGTGVFLPVSVSMTTMGSRLVGGFRTLAKSLDCLLRGQELSLQADDHRSTWNRRGEQTPLHDSYQTPVEVSCRELRSDRALLQLEFGAAAYRTSAAQ